MNNKINDFLTFSKKNTNRNHTNSEKNKTLLI